MRGKANIVCQVTVTYNFTPVTIAVIPVANDPPAPEPTAADADPAADGEPIRLAVSIFSAYLLNPVN